MTSEGSLNRADNGYRDVSYGESEAEHLYYTFRHFPELAVSKPAAKQLQEEKTDGSCDWRTMRRPKRPVMLKSTHKLKELSLSALDDSFTSLRGFRSALYNERSKSAILSYDSGSFNFAAAKERRLDLTPLQAANEKLEKLAVKYDSQGVNNDLKGFSGIDLSKKEFDTQLKRCLCVWLTSDELDALMLAMDTDGNGAIDGVEFIRYFFDLGIAARDRIRDERIALQARKDAEIRQVKKRDEERLRARDEQIMAPFTLEDFDNAIEKIGERLSKTAVLGSDSIQFQTFFGRMTASTFKIQLESCFLIKLKNAEVSSLLHKYGHELDGVLYVEGSRIVRELVALQQSFMKRKLGKFKTYGENKMKQLTYGNSFQNAPKSLGR